MALLDLLALVSWERFAAARCRPSLTIDRIRSLTVVLNFWSKLSSPYSIAAAADLKPLVFIASSNIHWTSLSFFALSLKNVLANA